MGVPRERTDRVAESLLRVYRSDETESDEPGDATDGLDQDPSSKRLEAEVEAFWAGRIPANRHSARVAA